jgi:cephalosporin hydroxylase
LKITLDTDAQTLTAGPETFPLYSPEAFGVLSRQWVRVGWGLKYSYRFTWLGRPIIQLPEDMIRFQEVVFQVKPDVIIETGVAHGGSLVYSASLLKLIGGARVVGVDIRIRPEVREALRQHSLGAMISLVEGSSVAPEVLAAVRAAVAPGQKVLVVLDSNHSHAHVLAELQAYADLVSPGSYLVATDGIMQDLTDVPGGQASWSHDNPQQAARDYAAAATGFKLVPPQPVFSEGPPLADITYWPSAYLRRD